VPKDIIITHDFAVPAERVFAALDDHANMGRWLGTRVSVVKSGQDGGVGTVRRIHTPLVPVDEEVIERTAPYYLVYRIVRGVPGLRFHRGEIRVEPRCDGHSWVHWRVQFEARSQALTSLILPIIGFALGRGLHKLEGQLV
jgi:uncharacterized protein YndB with AHSA1/START domain